MPARTAVHALGPSSRHRGPRVDEACAHSHRSLFGGMGHEALHENIRRFHGFEPLRVEGTLPADLKGTLLRTGPGLPDRFGVRARHPFLADGVLSAVRFDGRGGAAGAARPVQSEGYRRECRAGRRLYGPGASVRHRAANLLWRRHKSTGNTAVYVRGEDAYALVENARPVRFDPQTLETRGEVDFGGVLRRTFSAHPHRVPSLETTFNFGTRWGKTTYLDIYALPDGAPAERLSTLRLPWGAFIHDFAVTPTHLVILVPPARVRPLPATLGIGRLEDWFEWVPNLGTRALIVPLDAPDRVHQIELPAFWFFHIGATRAEGDALVVDVIASKSLKVLDTFGTERKAPPAIYKRIRLPLAGSKHIEMLTLWDEDCEFPRLDPRAEGDAPDACWVAAYPSALARLDLPDGVRDRCSLGEPWRSSEPVMVPSGPGSKQGYILSLAHHGLRNESAVVVLRADRLGDGPLATVWWGQTIPTTYHGVFVPA